MQLLRAHKNTSLLPQVRISDYGIKKQMAQSMLVRMRYMKTMALAGVSSTSAMKFGLFPKLSSNYL
jgi:hypothetical protein